MESGGCNGLRDMEKASWERMRRGNRKDDRNVQGYL